MALSAVLRTGQKVGRGRITQHLLGDAKDDYDLELSRLSTFGIGKDLSKAGWRTVIDQLLFDGVLGEDDADNRPTLYVADKEATKAIFANDLTMSLREDPAAVRPRKTTKKTTRAEAASNLSQADGVLFQALRAWRTTQAKARQVPPYVIFSDRSLLEIAALRPTSPAALRACHGVGEAKAATFGEDVFRVVREQA
jgi:ATP-dependent DNA helicase RecQ